MNNDAELYMQAIHSTVCECAGVKREDDISHHLTHDVIDAMLFDHLGAVSALHYVLGANYGCKADSIAKVYRSHLNAQKAGA